MTPATLCRSGGQNGLQMGSKFRAQEIGDNPEPIEGVKLAIPQFRWEGVTTQILLIVHSEFLRTSTLSAWGGCRIGADVVLNTAEWFGPNILDAGKRFRGTGSLALRPNQSP
mmetsp:Transcript_1691/g.3793  ORF Transcript_1691/g.3793 Transcript_1691/m.3793 type:complete len:112 (-) Transcript_1691:588-923(-)